MLADGNDEDRRRSQWRIITCNDVVLFIALTYSIVVLALRWDRFSNCKYPLQLFLIVHYSLILAHRMLTFISFWLKNYRNVVMILSYCKVLVIFPAFTVWTFIGTVWFAIGKSCLPEENEYVTMLMWLILAYLGIACYIVFLALVIHLGLFRLVFLSPEGLNPNDIRAGNPLLDDLLDREPLNQGLGEDLIRQLPSFVVTEQNLPHQEASSGDMQPSSCAICLEYLEVGQVAKRLTPCQHIFHEDHIDEWLSRRATCPLCRSRVSVEPNIDPENQV